MNDFLKPILIKVSTLTSFQHLFSNGMAGSLKKRFIAGDNIEDAIKVVEKLATAGFLSTIDFLGEEVKNNEKVNQAKNCYIKILDEINKLNLPSNISIKLSHFGIAINNDICYKALLELINDAKKVNNFVRIDMEGYNLLDKTLNIYKKMVRQYFGIGIVVQAYLLRATGIIEEAIDNLYSVRLCKGAYKEPPSVAYQDKKDVDDNYKKLAIMLLRNSSKYFEKFNSNGSKFCGIGLATHDHKIINSLDEYVKDNRINKNHFEFQMLYGVRTDLQKELIGKGYKVRIYVPFGKEWFSYTLRRMAERPANLIFVLRNIFS